MDGWRRLHRIVAVLFLLSIPPAAYFSFTGDPDSPHPVVYLPLFPLALMVITGNVDARAAVDQVLAGAAIVGMERQGIHRRSRAPSSDFQRRKPRCRGQKRAQVAPIFELFAEDSWR
jgi:hypothetical protein